MTIRGPYEYPKYYIGLSTDTKPPANIGDEFFETNTKKTYICYDGTNWSEKIGAIASDIVIIQSDVKDILSDLSNTRSDVNSVISDLVDIVSDIVEVWSDVKSIISDLIDIKSDINSSISDLVDVVSDLTDIRSDIVVVQSDVADVKSDVEIIRATVSDIKSDVQEVHSDVRSIISDLGDVWSDVRGIVSDLTLIQSDINDIKSDLIIAQYDTGIRVISGGSKTFATGTTKNFSFDSATNGAEIISIIVKGIIGAAWTLDVYVPTADAVASPAAGDKRDTITYLSTDTEGGLLQGFGIIYNGFLNFTNNGAGNQTITDVVIVFRSRAVLSVAWEA